MNTPHKWQKEIHAFGDGKVIQHRWLKSKTGNWLDVVGCPYFNNHEYEFRVKPEPKTLTYRVAMLRLSADEFTTAVADNRGLSWAAEDLQKEDSFVKWLEDEKTVELPE